MYMAYDCLQGASRGGKLLFARLNRSIEIAQRDPCAEIGEIRGHDGRSEASGDLRDEDIGVMIPWFHRPLSPSGMGDQSSCCFPLGSGRREEAVEASEDGGELGHRRLLLSGACAAMQLGDGDCREVAPPERHQSSQRDEMCRTAQCGDEDGCVEEQGTH